MKRMWIGACCALAVAIAGARSPSHASESAATIVDRMVDAHGGMESWSRAPSVSFSDEWTMAGSPMKMAANIIVEQGDRRALLEYPAFNGKIGWDGEKAWSLNWMIPSPPRFMALLNYYFVNLPWLVKDPGVVLGEPSTETLWDDPTEYIAIMVTYEAGAGDTPDDYYRLYIDPETYRLHGCAYVVTYPGLVPPGKQSTPEHILIYDEWDTVNGLVVPAHYTIYETDKSLYASCAITNWDFSREFDPAWVEMPEGAKVDTSLDAVTIPEGEQ